MAEVFMTDEQRMDHAAAMLAARSSGDRDAAIHEALGALRYREYEPVEISTEGTIDSMIVITLAGDEFAAAGLAEDLDNWEIDTGETGLTLDAITRDDDTHVTLSFTGGGESGTVTVKALAGALAGYMASNRVSVTVSGE